VARLKEILVLPSHVLVLVSIFELGLMGCREVIDSTVYDYYDKPQRDLFVDSFLLKDKFVYKPVFTPG